MSNPIEFLSQPASTTTSGQRAAALLGGSDTSDFAAISLGDLIYDRVSIDPQALEAFDFVRPANDADIQELAVWSHRILSEPTWTSEGNVNRLQGYVFERMAALSLRQSGAVVEFPDSPSEPGWDFLVNGERVQAKCGLSPHLVGEHLARYPDIPRVVVNQDLASHFGDNAYIMPIPGVTQELVGRQLRTAWETPRICSLCTSRASSPRFPSSEMLITCGAATPTGRRWPETLPPMRPAATPGRVRPS
jgi:hypothetical protein